MIVYDIYVCMYVYNVLVVNDNVLVVSMPI